MARKIDAEKVLVKEVKKVADTLVRGDSISLISEEYANSKHNEGFADRYDEWKMTLDKAFAIICEYADKYKIDIEI